VTPVFQGCGFVAPTASLELHVEKCIARVKKHPQTKDVATKTAQCDVTEEESLIQLPLLIDRVIGLVQLELNIFPSSSADGGRKGCDSSFILIER